MEKKEKIKKAIGKGGVLFYDKNGSDDRGVLINPTFIENKMVGSEELVSYWYNEAKEKIQLGKFVDLEEIEIRRERNKLL